MELTSGARLGPYEIVTIMNGPRHDAYDAQLAAEWGDAVLKAVPMTITEAPGAVAPFKPIRYYSGDESASYCPAARFDDCAHHSVPECAAQENCRGCGAMWPEF